ncbi:hypothetical protein J6590_102424 [Homalodisca vitripennis]|nr:hypothetical protein J6590_102424 [Homalodisca vitripennis]
MKSLRHVTPSNSRPINTQDTCYMGNRGQDFSVTTLKAAYPAEAAVCFIWSNWNHYVMRPLNISSLKEDKSTVNQRWMARHIEDILQLRTAGGLQKSEDECRPEALQVLKFTITAWKSIHFSPQE